MNTQSKNVATVESERELSIVEQIDTQVDKWSMSLPAQIPVERFKRVVIVAIQQNPNLVYADRKSLWLACSKAANDGLLPDGKEGALVIFKTKMKFTTPQGGSVEKFVDAVQWLPMIAGLRKKVRNSNQLKDWNARVVYEKDFFDFQYGDDEKIIHKPYIGPEDPGPVIGAYSIATFNTGEKSREFMARRDIEKVRAVSKSKDGPAWVGWFEEMARKSVAKRHSKVLPMSTDLDDLVRRVLEDVDPDAAEKIPAEKRPALSDFTSMPGGSTGTPVEEEKPAAEPAQEGETKHDPETGEVQDDKPKEEQATAKYGYAEAMEDGRKHRDANKPMSAPHDLDKQWHEAFLNGWRDRDVEISNELKKKVAAKK